jgi:hypothetical protein
VASPRCRACGDLTPSNRALTPGGPRYCPTCYDAHLNDDLGHLLLEAADDAAYFRNLTPPKQAPPPPPRCSYCDQTTTTTTLLVMPDHDLVCPDCFTSGHRGSAAPATRRHDSTHPLTRCERCHDPDPDIYPFHLDPEDPIQYLCDDCVGDAVRARDDSSPDEPLFGEPDPGDHPPPDHWVRYRRPFTLTPAYLPLSVLRRYQHSRTPFIARTYPRPEPRSAA